MSLNDNAVRKTTSPILDRPNFFDFGQPLYNIFQNADRTVTPINLVITNFLFDLLMILTERSTIFINNMNIAMKMIP